MSPSDEAIRRTCFYWGVYAYKTTEQGSLANTMYNALQVAKEVGVAEPGDLVVLTAGDPQTSPRLGDYTTSTNDAILAVAQKTNEWGRAPYGAMTHTTLVDPILLREGFTVPSRWIHGVYQRQTGDVAGSGYLAE